MISSVTLCIGGSFDCVGAGSCCSIGSFVATREYLPRPVFVILPVICCLIFWMPSDIFCALLRKLWTVLSNIDGCD